MVHLITGPTHAGKTQYAQKILEQNHIPYLSIDHLKMGLIRSGHCPLTPEHSLTQLTAFLWPIVKEIVKTCIENQQNITVEGCYIPFDYKKDFEPIVLSQIQFTCLAFHPEYIQTHFDEIIAFESIIEKRNHSIKQKQLLEENQIFIQGCHQYQLPIHWIGEKPDNQSDITKSTL